jgi:hypothetical protein
MVLYGELCPLSSLSDVIADLIALMNMGKLSILEPYCVKRYVLMSAPMGVVTAMKAPGR